MEENKIIKKRGISPVVTTVLLIVISVTAVLIVAGLIIPFVRNTLGESKECFEVIDQLTINTESGYTCYYNDSSTSKMIVNLTIKRGTKELDMEGFMIAVSGEGTSKTFEIKAGQVENVKMIDGDTTIKIPGKGEEMTYSINTSMAAVKYAEIVPIMNGGRLCKITDQAEIDKCSTF